MSHEQVHEITALIEAVDRFANAMKKKLIAKYFDSGWTGWSEKECFAGILADMQNHAERGPRQAVDIANLCMFLWNMIDQFDMDDKEIQELLDEHSGLDAKDRLDARATGHP